MGYLQIFAGEVACISLRFQRRGVGLVLFPCRHMVDGARILELAAVLLGSRVDVAAFENGFESINAMVEFFIVVSANVKLSQRLFASPLTEKASDMPRVLPRSSLVRPVPKDIRGIIICPQ